MSLSGDLLSQIVKATNPESDNAANAGSTVYGYIVVVDGSTYVRIDGSNELTPVTSTVKVKDGDRVSVQIKDHSATVTGNLTAPSASQEDVDDLGDRVDRFDTIIADVVTVEQLQAESARINDLWAAVGAVDDLLSETVTVTELLTASKAEIDTLKATKIDAGIVEATYATIESLSATDAYIHNLEGTYAAFAEVIVEDLTAAEAAIADLTTNKLSAEEASLKYAEIDFANIGEAAIEKLFSESGIIGDLIMSEGKVTGELIGVTIKGDLIEAGTLKADTLLVKGEDGLYYRLNVTENGDTTVTEKYTEEELQNGLLGSNIIAKSITAEKIAVDDLVAFDATIGGFDITEKAIHSHAKNEANASTPGVYMDSDGQFSVGDSESYIKFTKDEHDNFKLAIALSGGKTVEETIKDNVDNLQIGARNLIRNSDNLIFEDYRFANASESGVLGAAEIGLFTLGAGDDPGETVAEEDWTETGVTREVPASSSDYSHQGFVNGMTLHDYHLISMENAIIAALNKIPICTDSEEGSFLRVINGIPTWTPVPIAEEVEF